MLIAGIVFLVLLLIGLPIAYVLGATTIVYMLLSENLNMLVSIPQKMSTSVQNYGLLAIPLFVLAGELMNRGGITSRLIGLSQVLVGHFRGGLAYVNVVTNMFLASIIGSANAQTAMMSKVIVPEMEKQGYKKEFSSALTASASLIGPTIPPSIPFILYGVIAEVSIASMFIGGVIPGILLGIGFILLISLFSIKEKYPKQTKASAQKMFKSVLVALPSISIPLLIVLGIISGFFTATESAAIASLLAFLVGFFFYRELKLKDLPNILVNTAVISSIVTFIVAMATMFGWLVSFEKIPQTMASFLVTITESQFGFLLICLILFLFIGMIMEGAAAMIILVPVMLPVAVQYGIDPVHFGIMICLNLTLGLITPPVGTVLFITSSITKISFERLSKVIMPFFAVGVVVLLIVTYIPAVTTWLPSLIK
ncbi:TRAP transporter large permease [Niallia endozanthoxylica]|uniref:TRAP transporter large permease n=1 Tax=Niallia endozanthoxylica TaxID=2036016 RepID=A0A5J5I3Y9_9BACI|nr:TRAP transporter large permease [Niallia endozanthoxylica]